MQREETEKMRGIIHYFLMHIDLHTYIMVCTLTHHRTGLISQCWLQCEVVKEQYGIE